MPKRRGKRRNTNRHLPARMYEKHGAYWFVDRDNKWHRLGKSLPESLRAYADHFAVTTVGNMFVDVLERYLKEVASQKSRSYYQSQLNAAKYMRVAFSKMPMGRFTVHAANAYLLKREEAVSTHQAQKERAMLSRICYFAVLWGKREDNPMRDAYRPARTKARTRLPTTSELRAFVENSSPLIACYTAFKLATALRRKDILRIRIADLKEDGIHVDTSKTGKRLIIERSPYLTMVVGSIKALPGRPDIQSHLFSTERGRRYSYSGFTTLWTRAMDDAIKAGVLKERFWDSDIRAKVATDLSLEDAQKLLGHVTPETTKRWYRRAPERVKPYA